MADKKYYLTQEEFDALNKEYRNLIDVEQPKNLADLELARSQGDLSENADYDAARDKQAAIEARVRELDDIFHNVTIVTATGSSVADIGLYVTFAEADGETTEVKIAGNIGTNPFSDIPTVSNESPLAKALIGHKVGDTVNVEVENPYQVTITKISISAN